MQKVHGKLFSFGNGSATGKVLSGCVIIRVGFAVSAPALRIFKIVPARKAKPRPTFPAICFDLRGFGFMLLPWHSRKPSTVSQHPMETVPIPSESQRQTAKYPKSIPYIIGNEAAERFSFYGMRAILATFLVAQFFNPTNDPALQGIAEAQANEKVHSFVSLAYFMPVVGAVLADWFFGKYRVILYISMLYCVGHACLAMFDQDLTGFSIGLILIAIGAGGIKSNVSANVGDQFDESNQHLLSKVYGWFYFSINFGSVFANIFIPVIYKNYGAAWAFGVPGILMALATLMFWLGRKQYVRLPPSGIKRDNFLFISVYALMNMGKKRKGESWLDVAKEKFNPVTVEAIKSVYSVLAVFAFIPLFWALWDQCLSEWVLQARKLDLRMGVNFVPQFDDNWNFKGFTDEILVEQVQVANPVFLLTFIPLFTYGVFPMFRKIGINPTPLRRIGAGLFLTALSFVVISLIQQDIDAGGRPSVWMQILAYAILAAGETLVSVTGLEYAYTHSPKSMKSTMTAIWFLAVTVGNQIVAMINGNIAAKGFFYQLQGASYFWFFTIAMAINTLIFILISGRLKEKNYVESTA